MRRLIALITTSVLMIALGSTALGVTDEYGSYKDRFDEVAYDGSNGSIWWGDNPWHELGDDGSPGSGLVHVDPGGPCWDHNCLHLWGEPAGGEPFGAKRYADMSDFQDAELCFQMEIEVDLNRLDETDAVLYVEATRDGGDIWESVKTFDLVKDQGYHHPIIDITEFISEGAGVRFRVSGPFIGEVFIDDVELKGLLVSSTTTTSSSSTTTTTKATTTTTTKPTTTTTKAVTTTTSTSSTTTTTKPTTTSTKPTTTTKAASTTTDDSRAASTSSSTTTTSTAPATTVRQSDGPATPPRDTTSTTVPATTTTTRAELAVIPQGPPPDSGIREAAAGLQADYGRGAFGQLSMDEPDVLGVDFDADYTMAVELIESSWAWMLGLALLIATAIVGGMDRRRSTIPALAADLG